MIQPRQHVDRTLSTELASDSRHKPRTCRSVPDIVDLPLTRKQLTRCEIGSHSQHKPKICSSVVGLRLFTKPRTCPRPACRSHAKQRILYKHLRPALPTVSTVRHDNAFEAILKEVAGTPASRAPRGFDVSTAGSQRHLFCGEFSRLGCILLIFFSAVIVIQYQQMMIPFKRCRSCRTTHFDANSSAR
jgi:hypothetical protein